MQKYYLGERKLNNLSSKITMGTFVKYIRKIKYERFNKYI